MSEHRPAPDQKQLLIIGGVPRAGKDTTTDAFVKVYPDTRTLSVDEVRGELWTDKTLLATAWRHQEASIHSAERDLFQQLIDNKLHVGDEAWIPNILERIRPDGKPYFIERHDAQIRAIWQLGDMRGRLRQFVTGAASGRWLVQGVAMLPHYVAELRDANPDIDFRPLYLINQNPQHTEVILGAVDYARHTDPTSNWMANAGWSDNRVRKYMDATYELSARRRQEAEQYGFPWTDMGDGDFAANVVRNIGYLAQST
jgi:hypothetical protein